MPIPVEIQPFICHDRQNERPLFGHVLVDMAVTGQCAGPTGTAAIAPGMLVAVALKKFSERRGIACTRDGFPSAPPDILRCKFLFKNCFLPIAIFASFVYNIFVVTLM